MREELHPGHVGFGRPSRSKLSLLRPPPAVWRTKVRDGLRHPKLTRSAESMFLLDKCYVLTVFRRYPNTAFILCLELQYLPRQRVMCQRRYNWKLGSSHSRFRGVLESCIADSKIAHCNFSRAGLPGPQTGHGKFDFYCSSATMNFLRAVKRPTVGSVNPTSCSKPPQSSNFQNTSNAVHSIGDQGPRHPRARQRSRLR